MSKLSIITILSIVLSTAQYLSAEQVDSAQVGDQKCFLFLDASDGYSYLAVDSKVPYQKSGELPGREFFATGRSTISLKNGNDSASFLYEWNSGMSGGFCELFFTFEDDLFYADKVTINMDAESSSFSEVLELAAMDYKRSSSQFEHQGSLIIASGEKIARKPFAAFVLTYGAKKIAGSDDLSATASVKYTEKLISFSIEVTDDFVVPGESIHSDHVEIWWSDACFDGELNTKPGSRTRQLLIFHDGEKVVASSGYPEEENAAVLEDAVYAKTEKGYRFDFSISSEEIKQSNIFDRVSKRKTFEDGDVLLMSIVVSDADKRKKQESMIASSKLKWGNPSTFGRVVLVENGERPVASENLFVQ